MDLMEHLSSRIVMSTARSWVVKWEYVFGMAAPYNKKVLHLVLENDQPSATLA